VPRLGLSEGALSGRVAQLLFGRLGMMAQAYPLAIATIISCLGYGLGLGRLIGITGNLGDAGILGLTCVAILGCIIHFFSALTLVAQIATLGVGIALAVIFSRELLKQCKQNPVSVFVGFSAFFHRQAFTFYDTGLYHLQTFMWNSQFPITPGLVNLHERLAYNSTLFLIAPLDDRAGIGWVSNLVVLAFVLMSSYARLSQVSRNSAEFWFLTLTVVFLGLFPEQFSGVGVLNADGFAAILEIYWFAIWISLPTSTPANLKLLLLTAAFACTVKLSSAPLMVLTLVIAWLHRRTADVRPVRAMAVVAILLGVWMLRGFVLSGCAVYPLPQSCIAEPPWGISQAQASYEVKSIKSWARTPHRLDYDNVMANWTWVPAWAVRSSEDWSARLFLIGGIAALLCALCGVRVNRLVVAAGGGICVCLAYWFLSAPDVRFGRGYLAAAGFLGLSIACAAYFGSFSNVAFVSRLTIEAIVVSMLIGAAGLQKSGNAWAVKDPPAFVMKAGPEGRSVWVPQGGDQCWDHQLPCTPYFNADALRRVRWR